MLDPVKWRKIKWITVKAKTTNGKIKWKEKKRFKVALSTANPPQSHWTIVVPKYGIADKRLVITVAPQNDIWPHGRTYPIKAVPITKKNKITPIIQVGVKW